MLLSQCRALQTVSLDGNRIAQASEFLMEIAKSPELLVVDLNDNALDDSNCSAVQCVLQSCRKLKRFRLHHNALTDRTCTGLAADVIDHPSLIRITITRGEFENQVPDMYLSTLLDTAMNGRPLDQHTLALRYSRITVISLTARHIRTSKICVCSFRTLPSVRTSLTSGSKAFL
eukprot:m.262584 g.262584  ORF g.262584 m.262584 type:complete len:174 (-) comp54624_c0_seq6:774-1295(-)